MKFRRLAAIVAGVAVLASVSVRATAGSSTGTAVTHMGLPRLLATDTGATAVGIATFSSVPDATDVARLRDLGLQVQAMKHLPLAIVKGAVASMAQAVTSGAANDVYPDDHIQLLDTDSSNAMGAEIPRVDGYTGKDVTVAVVDSGCDATHADLADHVVHNVKLVGPEYANQRPDPNTPGDGALVIPIEQSPYQNSDLGSGHGTHVSGIIAADGHTGDDHLGVAPDANLVCYSIGEVLFTTAVVSAYDHMLDQDNLWDIDVVNNSWGNAFRPYDPSDPVNVATKAVADKGVVVVFAAGNSGTEEAEISLNPFSEAPWVLSVAAGDVGHHRGDFSSNGIEFDNSEPTALPAPADDGVTAMSFSGSRVGVYHPDVTAPGVDISSTCDTIGVAVGPCPPDSNETASGTSMASPHVAGAVAVLLQANPDLTVKQVRQALQSTATPVTKTDSDVPAPFWEAGYGYVNLAAAVDLVKRPDYADALNAAQQAATDRVLSTDPWRTDQSNLWAWAPPPVTLGGSDSQSFTVNVPDGTDGVKVALAYPSLGAVLANGFSYTATVTDASGKVLGQTDANFWNGSSTLLVDVSKVDGGVTYGDWKIDVTGDYAASDPDTLDSDSALGRVVTVFVSQLHAQ